jgi:hypothetical protein
MMRIITILLLFISLNLHSQTTSIISGKIRNMKKMPLKEVVIQVTYVPWNKIYNTISDKKGIYSIGNLSPGGPYIIKLTQENHVSVTKEVSSLDLGNNQINLFMEKK